MRRVARYADAHVVLSRYLHPEQFRADGIGEMWGERIGGWRGRFADLLRRLEAAGCKTYVAEWSHRNACAAAYAVTSRAYDELLAVEPDLLSLAAPDWFLPAEQRAGCEPFSGVPRSLLSVAEQKWVLCHPDDYTLSDRSRFGIQTRCVWAPRLDARRPGLLAIAGNLDWGLRKLGLVTDSDDSFRIDLGAMPTRWPSELLVAITETEAKLARDQRRLHVLHDVHDGIEKLGGWPVFLEKYVKLVVDGLAKADAKAAREAQKEKSE